MPKLAVTVDPESNLISIGERISLSLQRTLRLPDDGGTYPLPPSLGNFPVHKVEDYTKRVPASWREHGGVFIPMYQREAMWMHFRGQHYHPQAMKVAVGKVCAITGEEWSDGLHKQNYIVVPDQPWLDGINAGDGFIKQFVAMPLGMNYTVEGQVTGKEEFGGIQIQVFDAKSGRFPDKPPVMETRYRSAGNKVLCDIGSIAQPRHSLVKTECLDAGAEMGLAAGGRMEQKIYPDTHGIDTWDLDNSGRVYIHIVNSDMYTFLTGNEAPTSPVSAATYTHYGYPWFKIYDEHKGDVEASTVLQDVLSVSQKDEEHGFTLSDDSTVTIEEDQVTKIKKDPKVVVDGKW